MNNLEIANKIAKQWGWTKWDVLKSFLVDGGMSGNAFENASAAQTAAAIIEALLSEDN